MKQELATNETISLKFFFLLILMFVGRAIKIEFTSKATTVRIFAFATKNKKMENRNDWTKTKSNWTEHSFREKKMDFYVYCYNQIATDYYYCMRISNSIYGKQDFFLMRFNHIETLNSKRREAKKKNTFRVISNSEYF